MFRFSKDRKFNVPYGGRSYNLNYMISKIGQMKSNDAISYFNHINISLKLLNQPSTNADEPLTNDYLDIDSSLLI